MSAGGVGCIGCAGRCAPLGVIHRAVPPGAGDGERRSGKYRGVFRIVPDLLCQLPGKAVQGVLKDAPCQDDNPCVGVFHLADKRSCEAVGGKVFGVRSVFYAVIKRSIEILRRAARIARFRRAYGTAQVYHAQIAVKLSAVSVAEDAFVQSCQRKEYAEPLSGLKELSVYRDSIVRRIFQIA